MEETMDREASCYEKAANAHEYLKEQMQKVDPSHPCFLLKASDISSHLVVEFWVAVQQDMRQMMDDGATMTEALECARAYYKIPRLTQIGEGLTEKERGALEIAKAMMGYEGVRKVAD